MVINLSQSILNIKNETNNGFLVINKEKGALLMIVLNK